MIFKRNKKGSAVLCHRLACFFSAFYAAFLCWSPWPWQAQASNPQQADPWQRGSCYQQRKSWATPWGTGPHRAVFIKVGMEFDCNIMVPYCITVNKWCADNSQKRDTHRNVPFLLRVNAGWVLDIRYCRVYRTHHLNHLPLSVRVQMACTTLHLQSFVWTWLCCLDPLKALFTPRPPVQLLSGPEWVKFLIIVTKMNWDHSLVPRGQKFITSDVPQAVSPRKMI